jgi:hypothetical protein
MVQDTVNKFREFQAAGSVGFDPEVEELMEAFTNNLYELRRGHAT